MGDVGLCFHLENMKNRFEKGFRVCGRKESHAHRGRCAVSRTARDRTKAFRSPWTFGEKQERMGFR